MRKRVKLIAIAFSISFIIVSSLAFYTFKQFGSLTGFAEKVDQTNKVITELYKIENVIKELDIIERGFLLSNDSTILTGVDKGYRDVYLAMLHLGKLVADDAVQKNTLIMLKSALVMRMDYFKKDIQAVAIDKKTLSNSYFAGEAQTAECIKHIDKMLNREYSLLKERSAGRESMQYSTSSILRYTILIFFGITLVLFLIMISELRKRIESEEELQSRLVDLKNSHGELQQIAFASSHDLQEPLRKIKIWGDRLLWLQKDNPDKDVMDSVLRINAAANQVQELVQEVVSLTSLVNENQARTSVDLNVVIADVQRELEDKVNETKAELRSEPLPEISGYESQLLVLFRNLLDNALKFSKTDAPPLISIRTEVVDYNNPDLANMLLPDKKYHCITISDNGIGFDRKYIDKMFGVFQRLQDRNSGYKGKGIGLAICRRIMVNHTGYITANGHPGMGAVFKLYFPV